MERELYLTKSNYVAGIRCPKELWLKWHQRLPYAESTPGSIQDIGINIGIKAHNLFPGGVLIDEEPWEHEQAIARTKALIEDDETPAIFEAAFEHDGVRIRVDVLERDADRWHVHEVKSSSGVKEYHVPDIAVQVHVLMGCGIYVASAGIMHINKDYVRGDAGIDWHGFFARTELSGDIQEAFDDVPDTIARHFAVLNEPNAPDIEPTSRCKGCDYWDHCTKDKPEHWVEQFPRISDKKRKGFGALGVEDIRDVPEDFDLTANQDRMRHVVVSGETYVSPDLWKALQELGPPAAYLDFETMSPAIPLYTGSRPRQKFATQWSLHRLDENGTLTHEEFLATGDVDPGRAFAESLIGALSGSDEPIIVYSSFERTTINELIAQFPDLKEDLFKIVDRLKDLLKVVSSYVYHPAFKGSFSIKYVGPALAPNVDYGNLNGVADGQAASAAFERIASGALEEDESVAGLRAELLKYCELDTLAMVEIHRALMEFVEGN